MPSGGDNQPVGDLEDQRSKGEMACDALGAVFGRSAQGGLQSGRSKTRME